MKAARGKGSPAPRIFDVLLLEDSGEDAEIIEDRLRKDGLDFSIRIADSKESYLKALEGEAPDVILSDFRLPGYGGEAALDAARDRCPGVPFIFVTGTIGEENAVETLKEGAVDFVLKGNLARLVPAVRRAIKEKNLIRDRRVLFDALKESEERYRGLVENVPVGVFRSSIADKGRILQANPALARLYGCDKIEELYEISMVDLYNDPLDRDRIIGEFIENGRVNRREVQLKRKDSDLRWARITAVAHRSASGGIEWIDGIIEDITDIKGTDEELRTSEERFRGLFESTRDALMILEPPAWTFTSGNSAAIAMFGAKDLAELISYAPWQLSPENQPDGRESSGKAGEMIETAMREGSVLFDWTHRRINGEVFPATVLLTRMDIAGKQFLQATVRDVTDRMRAERELHRKNEELDLLLKSIGSVIIGVSIKDRITHWNTFAERVFGIKSADVIDRRFFECGIHWDWKPVYESISMCVTRLATMRLDELKYTRPDGKDGILGLTINPLIREGEIIEGFIILGRDITKRRLLENQLLQARKLEAIGSLAAGVAHEINSPLQYVGDNLKFLFKSQKSILEFVKKTEEIIGPNGHNGDCGQCAESLRELLNDIDFEYLLEEIPKAAEQSLDGITRVSKIVQSMKAFAHPGTGSKSPANINKSIENTAAVSRNEWKYDCDLELDLAASLPLVPCFEAELNQVVLNLIVNAVDAVKEAKQKGLIDKGRIDIRTSLEGGYAVIRVRDNGAGIPDGIRQRIFDPFFTTKEVGKGTGQGLAIAHSIIAEKHGGAIYCEAGTERGTTFVIRLPMEDV